MLLEVQVTLEHTKYIDFPLKDCPKEVNKVNEAMEVKEVVKMDQVN